MEKLADKLYPKRRGFDVSVYKALQDILEENKRNLLIVLA
jgi:hypothetical protein